MHAVEVAVPAEIRERHRRYGRRQLPALTEPAKAEAAVQAALTTLHRAARPR